MGVANESGTFSGVLAQAYVWDALSLTKTGSGIETLTGSSAFYGLTTVSGGTLYANVGNAANNRVLSYTSGIVINSGATLETSANALFGWDGSQDKPITVNAGGVMTADADADVGVGSVTLAGGTLANLGPSPGLGSWRFDTSSSTLAVTANSTVIAVNVKFANGGSIDVSPVATWYFTGTITDTTHGGTSTLILTGGGTLVLSNTNSYSGGTDVVDGTLDVMASDAISYGSSLTVGTNGTVEFGDPSASLPYPLVAIAWHAASPAGAVAAVPEPGTLVLLALGAVAAGLSVWRRRKAS